MKKSQAMYDLESLAASQWGMFTTAQAQNLGVRRNQIARMVDAGQVEKAAYGVYRFRIGEEPELADVKAAWLSAFPGPTARERMSERPHDAIVAGRTAAYAHGAGDFLASPYTFAVTRRKQTSREDMLYLERAIDERDVTYVSSLPVTSYERTVYDLIDQHEDPDLVDEFIRDASRKRRHQFDLERLSELLAPLAKRNGFGKMDGRAFANDLLRRNSTSIQMRRAAHSMQEALRQACDPEQMKRAQEQVDRMREAIAESGALEEYAEAMRKLQDAAASSGVATAMQDAAKGMRAPDFDEMPGIESMLKSMSAIRHMQSGNWAELIAITLPTTGEGDRKDDDGE